MCSRSSKLAGLMGLLLFLGAFPRTMALEAEMSVYQDFERLSGKLQWLNVSRPLEEKDLKGRVMLVDFWTYCCINCMHVIPDLKRLEAKYGEDLVVVGVHCGKFDAEKDFENIRQAVLRYGLAHPVVNDPAFSIWRAFGANSWPTLALIDSKGRYQGSVAGEGNYETLDEAIGRLLAKRDSKPAGALPMALEAAKAESRGLSFPGKVLAAKDGRVFIADSGHNRVVAASSDGKLLALIGSGAKGAKDGSFESASLFNPQGMALLDETLFIADTDNHLIRAADLKNRTLKTVAGTGAQGHFRSASGPGAEVPLNSPWDLAALPDGRIFIAMAGCHQIWLYDSKSGNVSSFSGNGRESIVDGPAASASFSQPSGLALNGADTLYVADSEVSAIRAVSALDGSTKTIVGKGLFEFGDVDGTGDSVRLQHPLGVAFSKGLLHVADTYNCKIKTVDPAKRSSETLALPGIKLSEPGGISQAGESLFIADTNAHRVLKADLKAGSCAPFIVEGLKAPETGDSGPQLCPLPPKAK